MELKGASSWHNNLKLDDYRSKVDYSLRKPRKQNIEEFKESLFKNLKKSPSRDLNITKDSKSSLASAPNYFSHYSSLRNFRNSSGLNGFKPSVSSFTSPKQAKSFFDLKEPSRQVPSPMSRAFGSFDNLKDKSLKEKDLQDILTIGTLSKATGLVSRNGLDKVSLSYSRQLKQFCGLVMQSLNN
jgi:hypothetical protein